MVTRARVCVCGWVVSAFKVQETNTPREKAVEAPVLAGWQEGKQSLGRVERTLGDLQWAESPYDALGSFHHPLEYIMVRNSAIPIPDSDTAG